MLHVGGLHAGVEDSSGRDACVSCEYEEGDGGPCFSPSDFVDEGGTVAVCDACFLFFVEGLESFGGLFFVCDHGFDHLFLRGFE